jgi:hypothetical protein
MVSQFFVAHRFGEVDVAVDIRTLNIGALNFLCD